MEQMPVDLPFRVEYATSGRAGCKDCKGKIDKGELRLAVMVQSSMFDSKIPNWFHKDCFFKKRCPATEGDVHQFENLRFEDQEFIRKKIADRGSGAVVAGDGKKGKKRGKNNDGESSALKDFGIEYSKSGRAGCRGCELKISKDDIRIRKTVYDTEVGMKYGGQPLWHHAECFAQVRHDLQWYASGDMLPGFKSLSKEDQTKIKDLIPAIKVEDAAPPEKKIKEDPGAAEDKELLDKIAKQSKKLFEYRDAIEKNLKNPEIVEILEYNNQQPFVGATKKLHDQLADVLTFGAFKPCPECNETQFTLGKSGYICNGNLTEWTKCNKMIKEPERVKCKIPSSLQKHSFLAKYKGKVQTRAIRMVAPSTATLEKAGVIKKEDELDGPKVKREKPALYGLEFVVLGITGKQLDQIKSTVNKLGGKVITKIHQNLAAVISTPDAVESMGSRMLKAKEVGVQVVPLDFLDVAKDGGAISYITSKSICDWGTDPNSRIKVEDVNKSKSKSIYTKSVPKSQKVKLKGGTAVDPDSGLDDCSHVYVKGNDKYTAVLGLTDIQSNKNSYYKLQLLESDNRNRFWLFRAWGRIGTTIGGNKIEDHSTLMSALEAFKSIYLEKTGNVWEDRDNFQKVPGLFYPIDIDYGEDEQFEKLGGESKIKSKLHDRVQELIKLIFDVESMKRAMLEFDLDMEKMPLGKLSKKQIQSAYQVLSEASDLIKNGGSSAKFIDCTNRFYTLIPHSFGVDSPPLLNQDKKIQELSEMLDSLLEIECAYSMLKEEDTGKEESNPIDRHYHQLKTNIEPLPHETEEFKLIQKYLQNTHAETHGNYSLEIVDVFKVARKGENTRYRPFKKLHNRKLLWHGSRVTNYAGILSHGLKIAPPEAPVTGYMFGKGIYFADMVSKSANYCATSKQNDTGLVLLSEVALGDMYERLQADYITNLPQEYHSTKGIGRTQPDPKEAYMREDGVEIPLGKGITNNTLKSSLLYNEFIVYDIAQVNIQYLLRLKFNYKY